MTFLQTPASWTAPPGAAGDGRDLWQGLSSDLAAAFHLSALGPPRKVENPGLRKQQLTLLQCTDFSFLLISSVLSKKKKKKRLVSTHNMDFVTHEWITA